MQRQSLLTIIFCFAIVLLYVIAWQLVQHPAASAAQTAKNQQAYFPYIPVGQLPTATVLPTLTPSPTPLPPPLPPPVAYSSAAPVNFPQASQNLQAQGLELAYNKIGFHVGIGGTQDGLGDWMRALDTAGVPFFLKSADHAGPIYEAQEIMRLSGVPHTLVFRRTGVGFDTPNYDLPPAEAAQVHWERHLSTFPPELDKEYVWLETVNEIDKERSDWLAEFALETAKLALRDGYKWAAFGWSSGEPEPYHWESPKMLEFLRLVSQHPDQLAIALHEYSYTAESIGNIYPYLVGRFQHLFQICDAHGIPRPTVFITEWGWEYQRIPEPEPALEDIAWAAWLYAAYPEVKGAAIWYLGGNFGSVDKQTQKLIAPLTQYSLTHYFGVTPGQGQIEPALFMPATDPGITFDKWPHKRPKITIPENE